MYGATMKTCNCTSYSPLWGKRSWKPEEMIDRKTTHRRRTNREKRKYCFSRYYDYIIVATGTQYPTVAHSNL